jgi:hypothetical protein
VPAGRQAPRAADPVDVNLQARREVVVDHVGQPADIQPPRRDVGRHQDLDLAGPVNEMFVSWLGFGWSIGWRCCCCSRTNSTPNAPPPTHLKPAIAASLSAWLRCPCSASARHPSLVTAPSRNFTVLTRLAKTRTRGGLRLPADEARTAARCFRSLAGFLCSAQTWTTCFCFGGGGVGVVVLGGGLGCRKGVCVRGLCAGAWVGLQPHHIRNT